MSWGRRLHLDTNSYLAGVLDTAGTFTVTRNGAQIYTSAVAGHTGALLTATFGGRWDEKTGHWYCPAKCQEQVCRTMLPYLMVNRDAASAVMQYRLTSPRRAMGWKVTPPIMTFREKLMARLRSLRGKEEHDSAGE